MVINIYSIKILKKKERGNCSRSSISIKVRGDQERRKNECIPVCVFTCLYFLEEEKFVVFSPSMERYSVYISEPSSRRCEMCTYFYL